MCRELKLSENMSAGAQNCHLKLLYFLDLIDASNCIESIIGTDLFPCPGENGDGDSWFFSGPDIPDPASHKYFEECSSPHDSGIASPGSISPSTGDFSPLNEPDHPSYPVSCL